MINPDNLLDQILSWLKRKYTNLDHLGLLLPDVYLIVILYKALRSYR